MSSSDNAPSTDAGTSERVESLLAAMDLKEKVGQLAGDFTGLGPEGEERTLDALKQRVREGSVGSVAPFGIVSSPYDDPREAVDIANELQRIATQETSRGLPLLICSDAIHGHAVMAGATVFPHNLALAATRDSDLVEDVADTAAREITATGVNQTYSPVCDVLRDPRWGRTYETFGESPFLCARLSAAKVRGYQGSGGFQAPRLAATPKHFPAYGGPERGEDASAVDCGPAVLHRIFLPPFQAAFDAGSASVMPCYNTIDDLPAHASKAYLSDLLRDELEFEGVTVSDWNAVWMLHEDQRCAPSRKEAAKRAFEAGLDVASVGGAEYAGYLAELVGEGTIAETSIDERVRRVLSLKERLGLFEDPYVDSDRVTRVVGIDDHRARARDAVHQSLTLLKNDGEVLPLSDGVEEVLVTGPVADDLWFQVGGWSALDRESLEGTTILEGMRTVANDRTRIVHEPGSTLNDSLDLDAAAHAAASADVAVVVLGEGWYVHEFGPSILTGDPDSFPARHRLEFPDAQLELLKRVHATGTPTVLLMIAGRPMMIPWATEHVPAIMMGYYPGSEGTAVAEVLFGQADPGGRLPVSVPRSTGRLPTLFNHLPHPFPVGKESHPPSYDPLYAFGHGLSYTDFEHRDMRVTDHLDGDEGHVEVSVQVANVGDRAGQEVLDVFVTDEYSSRVTPVRELVGFTRLALEPGEQREVVIPVDTRDLGVVQPDGQRVLEPGRFCFRVADCSATLEVEAP